MWRSLHSHPHPSQGMRNSFRVCNLWLFARPFSAFVRNTFDEKNLFFRGRAGYDTPNPFLLSKQLFNKSPSSREKINFFRERFPYKFRKWSHKSIQTAYTLYMFCLEARAVQKYDFPNSVRALSKCSEIIFLMLSVGKICAVLKHEVLRIIW